MRISTLDAESERRQCASCRTSRSLSQTQGQLATGKSINTPSDNPVGEVQLLQLDATANSQYQQYVSNGQSANTNLTLEERRCRTSTTTLQSIRDLVVQANSGSNNASDLQNIATQISALENQLQGAANSQNAQGRIPVRGLFHRHAAVRARRHRLDQPTWATAASARTAQRRYLGADRRCRFERLMNIPAGNGTFTTAVSAGNTGTGVIDAGSVTDAATWNAAAGTTPPGPPYTITFSDATDYQVTDASGNPVTSGTYDSQPVAVRSPSTASRSASPARRPPAIPSRSHPPANRGVSIRWTTWSVL